MLFLVSKEDLTVEDQAYTREGVRRDVSWSQPTVGKYASLTLFGKVKVSKLARLKFTLCISFAVKFVTISITTNNVMGHGSQHFVARKSVDWFEEHTLASFIKISLERLALLLTQLGVKLSKSHDTIIVLEESVQYTLESLWVCHTPLDGINAVCGLGFVD